MHFENFFEFINFQHAIQQPRTILSLRRLRLFLFHLPNDLFENIVDGDQPLQAAELVNDKEYLCSFFFEDLKGARGEHGLWNEERWFDDVL